MSERATSTVDDADLDEYDVDELDDEYDDDETDRSVPKSLALILIIGGLLGFVSAFTLTIERIEMLLDSNYMPTCSIDSVLQCGTVMT